jgi:dihydrofolate reductase
MGIGLDNRILWRLSSDVRRFKLLTMGHPLIMGRKTYQSIGKSPTRQVKYRHHAQSEFQAEVVR